jgi:hypothetical protein
MPRVAIVTANLRKMRMEEPPWLGPE